MNITIFSFSQNKSSGRSRVAQSVTCLTADACLTSDPGVASPIPVGSLTFMEIDHEIILMSFCSFRRFAKVCARSTG